MTHSDFMPIERYYALKSVLEQVWGKDTYLQLKHCSSLKVWKKHAARTLSASKLAIEATVTIKDDDWQEDVEIIVSHGIERIKRTKSFDELFQVLSASYIELSFHQIGRIPCRPSSFRPKLRKDDWKLGAYRTVQYVQTLEQKVAVKDRIECNKRAKGKKND